MGSAKNCQGIKICEGTKLENNLMVSAFVGLVSSLLIKDN
jgi:hypothetical protein